MTPAEQEALRQMLAEMAANEEGDPTEDLLFARASRMEYARTPVDMETFVRDPYYLGETCDALYDVWLADLKELFEGDYTECLFTGSIGSGKSFAASVGVCRVLYEISCLKDPHKSYGLAPGTNISVVCLSVSEALAVKVVFENIVTKIQASPYFKEHFPFTATKKELRFPRSVWVAARASTDTSALGLNCISAFMDEGNFMPDASKDQKRHGVVGRAESIYYTLKRRLKSRFARQGKLPGILFIVSSKRTRADFTEKLVRTSREDPHLFVRDYAIWETVPKSRYSSDETFQVLVGNEQIPSRILKPGERDAIRAELPADVVMIDVPEDYRRDFEQDLEQAIRDIAGISTVAMSPYIQRRSAIEQAIHPKLKHPFSVESYDPTQRGDFLWELLVRDVERRDTYGTETVSVPRINPQRPRHAHIDPSLTGDATGLVVAHVAGYRNVLRSSKVEQARVLERAPVIIVDFLLQIVPPLGDEIVMGDVRRLLYLMSSKGFRITKVTSDTYQSRDGLQQLRAKGYDAEILSVDRTADPYDTLKTALYENRIFFYNYAPLIEELRRLERDGRTGKVDHPKGFRKDVADALAGVVHTLTEAFGLQQEPLPIITPGGDIPLDIDAQGYLSRGGAALPPIMVGGVDELDSAWVTDGSYPRGR